MITLGYVVSILALVIGVLVGVYKEVRNRGE